ncbi:hypothetical protein D9613_011945 [Agrocybe pediades]|uniref:Uncharacterized protein n=1 Tax=Agrocybe pediades TaxID=84607 RepID=A0A8H4VHR7_9AGAR|nr:hypothetical protein D9613_011945 [Agrocybe pediades]
MAFSVTRCLVSVPNLSQHFAQIGPSEVLIAKDSEGFFIGPEGKLTRSPTIQWPISPEE